MLARSPMLSRFAAGGDPPDSKAAMARTRTRSRGDTVAPVGSLTQILGFSGVEIIETITMPPYTPAPEVSFTHQLLSLELWLLGLRLPRAVVASIFPLCGWVWGAQGFGVAVLSYTLYTAMVWSSGDYAPARWNELMVDQQLDDDEATAGDECPPCPPAGGPLHQRTSKS